MSYICHTCVARRALRWSDFQKISKTNNNTCSAPDRLLNDKHFGIGFIIYGELEPSTHFIP